MANRIIYKIKLCKKLSDIKIHQVTLKKKTKNNFL